MTVIPAAVGIHGWERGWVPVSTGTTEGGGAPTIHSRAGGSAQPVLPVIPATAGIHGWERGWVPVSTGTTEGGGAPHKCDGREGGESASLEDRALRRG